VKEIQVSKIALFDKSAQPSKNAYKMYDYEHICRSFIKIIVSYLPYIQFFITFGTDMDINIANQERKIKK